MVFKYNHSVRLKNTIFGLLFVLFAFVVLFSTTMVANNLSLMGTDNKNYSSINNENPKNYSLLKHLEKQKNIIQQKDVEIETKQQRIVSLSSAVSLLTFLLIATFLLAVFYWRKTTALELESLRIKSELDHYLFEAHSENPSLSLEEIRAQKLLLNERQQKILDLIAFGFSNKQIANKLFISENTVKYHIKNIYHLLKVKDRKELWFSQS